MQVFNLFADEGGGWDRENDRDGYRHKVTNASAEPARLLILSSKSPLAVVHYPDSQKLGIWSREGGYQAMLPAEPTLDYCEGE